MNLCVIIVLKKEASEVKALTGYYYSKMDKEEQAVYFSLEEGIRNVKQKFYVPRLEGNKIFDIHFLMRLDNPDIFYSSQTGQTLCTASNSSYPHRRQAVPAYLRSSSFPGR